MRSILVILMTALMGACRSSQQTVDVSRIDATSIQRGMDVGLVLDIFDKVYTFADQDTEGLQVLGSVPPRIPIIVPHVRSRRIEISASSRDTTSSVNNVARHSHKRRAAGRSYNIFASYREVFLFIVFSVVVFIVWHKVRR